MIGWFNDLKIRAKLLVGFGVVAAAVAVIGFVGIQDLRRINAADSEMYTNYARPLQSLGEARSRFQQIRLGLYKLAFAGTPEESRQLRERVYQHDAALDSLLRLYEPTMITPADTAVYRAVQTARAEYLPVRDHTVELLLAGRRDEAVALLRGEAKVKAEAVDAALTRLAAFNAEQAELLSAQNTVLTRRAIFTMGSVLLAGILLALLIGWTLSQRLSRAVRTVADRTEQLRGLCVTNLGLASRAMAHGDLEMEIVTGTPFLEVDSRDELGALSESINGMIRQTQATVASFEEARRTLRGMVAETNGLVSAASEGRLSERGEASKYEGSYRELVAGINQTLDAILAPVNEASGVLRRLAEGDFTRKVEGDYRGDHAVIKDSLNRTIDSLRSTLERIRNASGTVAATSTQIRTSSQSLASAAEETSRQSQTVGAASEQAGVNVQTVAVATEQMSGSIREISRQLQEALRVAQQASGQAEQTVRVMDELGTSSEEIGE
ncbi:MAG: MCP four helix bundle domain-containing protein, partial [Gemmatimonadetes bacterium]|nr:MCP four helix bundle domain-containing protein [Gemmatimonadota bacterium]